MTPLPTAISARVSSAQQAEAQTVARQVAAWRERGAAADLRRPEARPCMDAGESGATRVRPALARWRDRVAAGAVDRLEVPAPDRLARQDASHVRRVDALPRAGVAVVCWNRELGHRPEDELRLPVHGRRAEDERATIIERHRRGQRQAARAGGVHGLRGAPAGDRDGPQHAGGGQARDDIVPAAARVVRQGCAWVGRARLTLGAVCRRLPQAGEATRTGKTIGARSAVWGMRKHPADMGAAAVGTTRQGPLQPRLRPQRGRPWHPTRAVSSADVPPCRVRGVGRGPGAAAGASARGAAVPPGRTVAAARGGAGPARWRCRLWDTDQPPSRHGQAPRLGV
jgi:site-specific DNA recombinase